MSRSMKRAALGLGAALAVVAVLLSLTAAVAVFRPGMLRPLAEALLRPAGGAASLEGLEAGLRPPFLVLRGLEVRWSGSEDRLRVERLRAVPVPGRILGAGPWLRQVEVQGVKVRRRLAGAGRGGPPDLSPLSWLFVVEDLSIREAQLDLGVGDTVTTLNGLSLSLVPAGPAGRELALEAEVNLREPGGRLTQGRVNGTGEMTPGPALTLRLNLTVPGLRLGALDGDLLAAGDLALSPKRLELTALDLALSGAGLWTPPGRWDLGTAHATLAGEVRLDGSDPRLEVSRLEVGDLLRGRGSLSGPTLSGLAGWMDGTLLEVGRLQPGFAPLLPADLKDLGLQGELPFRLEGSASRDGPPISLELRPEALTLSWPSRGGRARMSGTLKVTAPPGGPAAGTWPEATLEGRLDAVADLVRPPLVLQSLHLALPLSGPLSALRSRDASLSAGAGQVVWEGRALPLGAIRARGSLALDAAAVRADILRVDAEALGHLEGDLTLGQGILAGRVTGRSLPLRALSDLLRAAADLPGQAWPTEGSVDVTARVEPDGGGKRATAQLHLQGATFSSPDGEVLAQGLGGDLAAEWRTRPGSAPRLAGELSLGRGEALWGTVYLDLSRSPFHLRASVTPRDDALEAATVEARLQGFARLNLTGDLRREGAGWRHRGRLVVEEAELAPLFQTFVRDPLAASRPGLAGLQAGGKAKLDLQFSGLDREADLRGRLEVQAARLAVAGEPELVSGVDLDLPLAYSLGRTRAAAAPPEVTGWGRLRLEGLAGGGVALGPLDLPVALVPNYLYLGGTVEVPLFGGRLVLSRIRVDEPLSPAFRATLSADLEGLDLGRVPVEGLRLEGKLEGALGTVTVGTLELAAAGSLEGELFGGRLEAHGLAVRHPFGAGREIAGDFEATGMDLERLSAALDLGRVTGSLTASLEGLRVAYGQPVAFHLRAASVPVKGVEQRVSLKAVNSISLLATGSALGGAGLSFLTSLFRQFPYDRIGFECGLENDVFTVRGLIREGGVEYLVKRPFLGGINVINQNPDNRIRFSDMVRRLSRLTQEHPGPEPRP